MSCPRVSIVIPAYNEEECIADCVEEVCSVMDGLSEAYEVIVVDDGSTDGTLDQLRALKSRFPQLRVLSFEANAGETAAMDAGLKNARGEFVATMDADLQNDPADIPRMLELAGQWDVVCGVRAGRRDSLLRRISSRIANSTRNRLTHENIRDVGCTLRVFRAPCLKGLKLYTGMHRFLPTLLRMDGWSITEVPVNHRPRTKGRSKYGVWNRLFRALYDLFGVRWMQARWLRYRIREEL
ncbi:MAG: glycosyl transferase [Planctomycetes bacterium SM23_32]|nr:MAG: glycosyl transferase [Planctomycetes bacterium SM23_32]